MARTKASVGAKVYTGKSHKARCSTAPPPPSTPGGSGGADKAPRSAGGGNPVCPRETPKWQRAITTFFINKPTDNAKSEDIGAAGSSKPKPKRNIIESDDEEKCEGHQTPKNTELDETINLEPLTGEDSHKIEEYYPKNEEKGKGVGKKTKGNDSGKENLNNNVERKKREREDTAEESTSKKVKI